MAAALGVDELISVGATGAAIGRAAQKAGLKNSRCVDSPNEAAEILGKIASSGDLILVKGSRSAGMERVLEQFAKLPSTAGVTS